jgi:hypothetical protein
MFNGTLRGFHVLKDVEYEDRIEAVAADGGGPISIEVHLNMAEVRMICGAPALCVVHCNILIDYSSIDASVRMGEANRAAVAATKIKQFRSCRQRKLADEVMQAGRRRLDRILPFPVRVREVELWVVENLELHKAVLAGCLGAGPSVPETVYITDLIAIEGWDRHLPNGKSRRDKLNDDVRIKIEDEAVCLKWDFPKGGSAVGP